MQPQTKLEPVMDETPDMIEDGTDAPALSEVDDSTVVAPAPAP